jgi:hypothetical protein
MMKNAEIKIHFVREWEIEQESNVLEVGLRRHLIR